MAARIIEQWQLAVLKVQLDLSERTPAVATDLVAYPTGVAQTMWSQRYGLDAFGLEVDHPAVLTMPTELRDAVAQTLLTDLNSEAALWLRLVPPYGYLGAVPWEGALIPATGLPLLRVPDRLPAASDLGRKWRAVIAISAPPHSDWAAPYVRSLVNGWQNRVRADVEVDIFADAGTAEALQAGAAFDSQIRVHDPADAARASGDAQPSRSAGVVGSVSPVSGQVWADWITAGLAGQAVRALHVVLDGVFDGDRPMLAVAPDPQEPSRVSSCAFVSPDAVLAIADRIGSAALSFGSPPENPTDLAVRMIADELGQLRPGATIYSSLADDPQGRALAAAHAFVVDRTGQTPIPRDRSLFAYLQPEHVEASLTGAWPDAAQPQTDEAVPPDLLHVSGPASSAALESFYADSDSVPSWVASWDRYLSKQTAGLAQEASSPEPTADVKGAYNKGAADALGELRNILDRHTWS